MPRKGKGKGKGRKPRGKRGWLWLLLKLAIVFAVLIAIYGVYLDQKIRSRIDGSSLATACGSLWPNGQS